MPAALDAALLGGWVTAAVATLERHAAEVDRINVFPVADRDTGTNLLLTLRAAAAEPWEVPVRATGFAGPAAGGVGAGGVGAGGVAAGGVGAAATGGGDVRDAGSRTGVGPLTVARAAALARGALRGARGNSGVLLSQVFRGLAEAVAHAAAAVPAPAGAPSGAAAPGERDGAVLADGLTRAAALAAAAVSRPREGTVLTVLAAAAAAARAAAGVGRVGPAAGEYGVDGSDPAGAGRPGSAAAGEYGVDGWDPGGTGRVGAVDAGGVADRSGPVGAGGAGLLAPPGVGEGRDAESGGTGGTGRLALVATAAADAAGAVLLTTTARLPELARARVVDAGGLGLHLVLDALAVLLTGRPPAVPRTEAAAGPPGGAGTEEGVGSDGGAGTAGAGEGAGGIDDGSRTGVAAPIGVPAPTGVGGRTATPVHGTPSSVGRGPARPGPAAVGYEVMYLLDGSDDRRAAALRGLLDALGDAVAVVGDGAEGGRGTWTVHVHCADIGAALEAGLAAGRPHAVRVAPLVERDDDPAAGHGGPAGPRATPPTGRPGPGGGPAAVGDAHVAGDAGTGDGPGGAAECGVPVVARAVVALVGGPEVAALAAAAGAHVVRYDGPTAAASAAVGAGHGGAAGAGGTADGATGAGGTPDGGTGDGGPADGGTGAGAVRDGGIDLDEAVAAAVAATGALHVVLLPCDPAVVPAAERAAAGARHRGREVVVVPAASPVAGLAALAVHDATRHAGDDVVAMAEAAAGTRSGMLQVADTEALTWAGRCRPGDVLGLVDGEVVVIAPEVPVGVLWLAARMLTAGGELVTLLLGAEVPDALGEELAARLRRAHPAVDVVVHRGARPGHPVELGVE